MSRVFVELQALTHSAPVRCRCHYDERDPTLCVLSQKGTCDVKRRHPGEDSRATLPDARHCLARDMTSLELCSMVPAASGRWVTQKKRGRSPAFRAARTLCAAHGHNDD